MAAIGNSNSFRATNVPPPKAPPAASPPRAAPARAPATVVDVPHGAGTLTAGRSAPSRPASAYRNPAPTIAAKIAAKPSRSNAPTPSLQRIIGKISDFAATNPFAPIATYGPGNAQALAGLRLQGELGQIYRSLKSQNLLPSDAHLPQVSLTPDAGPGAYTVPASGGAGHIFYSPDTAIAATNPSAGAEYSWALQGLVHELAHSMQSRHTLQSVPLREGGAQAYADAATPQILGPLAQNDLNYSGYVQDVRRKGPAWFMRQQFGPR